MDIVSSVPPTVRNKDRVEVRPGITVEERFMAYTAAHHLVAIKRFWLDLSGCPSFLSSLWCPTCRSWWYLRDLEEDVVLISSEVNHLQLTCAGKRDYFHIWNDSTELSVSALCDVYRTGRRTQTQARIAASTAEKDTVCDHSWDQVAGVKRLEQSAPFLHHAFRSVAVSFSSSRCDTSPN